MKKLPERGAGEGVTWSVVELLALRRIAATTATRLASCSRRPPGSVRVDGRLSVMLRHRYYLLYAAKGEDCLETGSFLIHPT